MSIKLDLNQFKHIKSDKQSTTLQHKDGHQLTIAHHTLTPESRTQLQALSKMADTSATPIQRQEAGTRMADGGKVGSVDKRPKAIHADSRNQGVQVANMKRPDRPHGATITVPDDTEKKLKSANPYGKVQVKGEEQPKAPSTEYTPREQQERKPDDRRVIKLASGGEVNPKLEQSKKVPRFCAYCGGMAHGGECTDVQHYADGTDDVQAPAALQQDAPTDTDPMHFNADQAVVDSKEQVAQLPGTPEQRALWDKYNQLANNENLATMNGAKDPTKITFNTQTGAPPQELNTNLVQSAQQSLAADSDSKKAADASQQAQISQENAVRASIGAPLLPQAQPQQPDVNAEQGNPQPELSKGQEQANQQQRQPNNYDPNQMLQSGYQNTIAGIQGKAAAEGALGQKQSDILAKQAAAQQGAQAVFQQQFNALGEERQNFIDDIRNGHINPEQYWTGTKNPETGQMEGGHSKIASAIGMILAGFNPTSNPNAAIGMIKYQMDKNMEAQVQNLGAKKTLLEANLRQYGNLQAAQQMTRVMMNDAFSNQLQMEAAKAQNPMAQSAAQQAVGQLQMDSSNRFRQLAMMQAMTNIGKSGDPDQAGAMLNYMRAMNPEMAKQYEPLYVPGVGMAKAPVSEASRKQIGGYQDVMRNINEALNFKKTHPGAAMSPGDRAQAQTLMSNLSNQVRTAEDMGVFKESEAKMMQGMLGSSPADFTANITTNPKLKEMLHLKQSEYNNLLKIHGLPVQQQAAPQNSQQQAMQWAQANPKDPRAAKIMSMLGQKQ